MGETQDRPFQLSFNSSLKVDFQGSRVTSDGGLVLVRELDERLGLSELMDHHLSDSRRGKNIQLPLADLLRQSIYSRLAGYDDVNDAARLSQDPAFRLIGSRKFDVPDSCAEGDRDHTILAQLAIKRHLLSIGTRVQIKEVVLTLFNADKLELITLKLS